nr:hypothetical protein [Tanacetum cinerariifolium]
MVAKVFTSGNKSDTQEGSVEQSTDLRMKENYEFWHFYYSDRNGVDVAVPLESIRANNPFILKKWDPKVNLIKEDVGSVSVWVKLHGVPMTAFSEGGLSVIATKLVMIELRADVQLKDTILVTMPKLIGDGFYMCTICVEYEWKPHRCSCCKVGPNVGFKPVKQVYKHVSNKNSANTSGKMKRVEVPIKEVSISNLFDALNFLDNDDDLGTNERNSNSAEKGSLHVAHGSSSNTHITYNIDKIARQILDASTSFKGGSDRGYGTNSLLKQWKEIKRDDDYDPYDDDLCPREETLYEFDASTNPQGLNAPPQRLKPEAESRVSSYRGIREEEPEEEPKTSQWNEDLVSDDEVDEFIFPEGDKFGDEFDIRLKGQVRK